MTFYSVFLLNNAFYKMLTAKLSLLSFLTHTQGQGQGWLY